MKRLLILLAFLSSAVLLAGCNRVSLDESVMIALDWVIPPELPHEHIRMCSCGRFFLGTADSLQWDEVDPATGKLTDGFHGGHGMGEHPWVHDPALGLFGHGANDGYGSPIGLHPLENFEENVIHAFTFEDGTVAEHMFEWILPRARGLLAVESVDSTKREYHDSGGWITWWLTQDAFSGRFALMYNLDFTTDFIFDEVRQMQRDFVVAIDFGFVAVRQGDMWGMVDRYGNEVLPLIFENLLIIDEGTAFARYQGAYGILDITSLND